MAALARLDAAMAAADPDQVAMMEEKVILLDEEDNVIGYGSKKDTHLMANIDRNMLHRAFSVFMITPDGRLTLQKRAAEKITYASVYANTVCSHPLTNMTPSEEEGTPADGAIGVIRAARRKMQQELGIDPAEVPESCFQFVTRIHYSAPSNDADGIWGEHEIDYILICTPPTAPTLRPNPNEVAEVRAFTPTELAEWVDRAEARGDVVAPWFHCMERTLLYKWWLAVYEGRLDDVVETDTIHRFGRAPYALPASDAVMAEAVRAQAAHAKWGASRGPTHVLAATATSGGAAAGLGDAAKKQGAYGKVVTHKQGLLRQLMQFDEVWAAVLYKSGLSASARVQELGDDASAEHVWCEQMLGKVSRSFAMVIKQLSPRLRRGICVFYLVLRGLDTVEDDMTAFKGREEEKLEHLRRFHTYLASPHWSMRGVGEGDEATLLEEFGHVVAMHQALPGDDRRVIRDICARMGEGMARYAGRDLTAGTEDLTDYNLYCHYVAGLVGEGLSRLFATTGRESESVARELTLANDMGLFLQKTNIIRDYLEDLVEGRAFWPKGVWGLYAKRLADLRGAGGPSASALSPGETAALAASGGEAPVAGPHVPHAGALECLNHLVADALAHAPNCVRYLAQLKSDDVFRFCAIPQVMAIATLDELTNNDDVFTGVVKIRKGTALRLMGECDSFHKVLVVFLKHSRSILAKIPAAHEDAHAQALTAQAQVEELCLSLLPHGTLTGFFSARLALGVLGALGLLLRHLYARSKTWGGEGGSYLPRITDSWDVFVLAAVVACVMYVFAFMGVPFVAGLNGADGDKATMLLQDAVDTGVPTSAKLGSEAYSPEGSSGSGSGGEGAAASDAGASREVGGYALRARRRRVSRA